MYIIFTVDSKKVISALPRFWPSQCVLVLTSICEDVSDTEYESGKTEVTESEKMRALQLHTCQKSYKSLLNSPLRDHTKLILLSALLCIQRFAYSIYFLLEKMFSFFLWVIYFTLCKAVKSKSSTALVRKEWTPKCFLQSPALTHQPFLPIEAVSSIVFSNGLQRLLTFYLSGTKNDYQGLKNAMCVAHPIGNNIL